MTAVLGSNRVNRGGSWINNARNCRASNRNNNPPGNRNNNLGFRLLSTRRRQGARFTDRARVPGPSPGGSSCSGEQPDEQQQPAASGRPECATAVAGNPSIPDQAVLQDSGSRAPQDHSAAGPRPGDDSAVDTYARTLIAASRRKEDRPEVSATSFDTDSPPAKPSGRRPECTASQTAPKAGRAPGVPMHRHLPGPGAGRGGTRRTRAVPWDHSGTILLLQAALNCSKLLRFAPERSLAVLGPCSQRCS